MLRDFLFEPTISASQNKNSPTYQTRRSRCSAHFVSPSQVHLVQLLDLYGFDAKYNGERFVFITTTTGTLKVASCFRGSCCYRYFSCVCLRVGGIERRQMMICIIDLKRIVSLLPIAAGNLDLPPLDKFSRLKVRSAELCLLLVSMAA